ncbi:CBS domain-containing protein [Aestuariicella sp. G3-2]|uniref:HlyC/CorC family transporter n=1 Tax=Pseudomaricurvus albidus TaxID=2842452 RepID=UPI001C0C58CF|nr:transporter associated domain-containing protein [Aestuariicella albida]MBU3070960.1 CBS domain-containing protein [Aestuariicella albida]
MSEDPSSSQPSPSRHQDKPSEKSWLDRVFNAFSAEPKSREELLEIIKEAAENKVVDAEELEIIQGALDVADQQVREIQVPRSQMVVVNIDAQPAELLPMVIESGHSRFPVVGESTDDIRGILLAKDLLPLILNGTENFNLDNVIRPATVIPESKRLNVLLREFRENRYHMAMVIDEYGGISGLVTIEDILEEIVGEIEDETDEDADDAFIRKVADNDYIIKALTPIEDFNEYFNTGFNEDEFDTIGGILMRAFGHLPQRNEVADIDGYQFRVLYADSRQIHLVRLSLPS